MKFSALLSAAAIALLSVGPLNAQTFDPDADIFDHNGSMIIAQYKYGNLRYMEVKPSLRGLVDRGMAAFSGQIERRGKAYGTAYVFKKGCDFVPYEVRGAYDASIPGYVLKGKYPVRSKKGCDVVGWSEKGSNARLVFVDISELERRDVAARKAEEDAYVQQIYETESDPDWFDGFISSEELEARQKKGTDMATCNFTVSGKWPFPMDMLRYDGASAATPEDEAKIRSLTREHCDDRGFMHERHSVDLVIPDVGPHTRPCEDRWDSFGWHVENGDLAARRAERQLVAKRQALRDSAMAKLTPEEREAVAYYKGR